MHYNSRFYIYFPPCTLKKKANKTKGISLSLHNIYLCLFFYLLTNVSSLAGFSKMQMAEQNREE